MVSGAGGAVARRRRDFRSWFLFFSFLSVNPPKNPNLSSSGFIYYDRQLCNGAREQCFLISLNQTSPANLSFNRATEFLHQSNDILGQTSGHGGFSGFAILVKQVLHRRKPAPLASPHPSNRVWSNLINTDELWRSRTLPEKIMTEGFGLCASNRRIRPPHTSTKNNVARGKTLISLMDFSVSPSFSSPLSLLSWPISKPFGPAHLTTKNRFASNFLQNSASSMARFFNMNGRGLHFCLDSTSMQCDYNICLRTLEVDWKKAQVDSKKILAQPHQSATTNPSRQGANPESTPPVEEDWKKAQVDSKKILAQPHQSATANPSPKPSCINMIGITGDILSIAKSYRDLSIRFIPRSENMFDDLATAVWSMTLGHNISLYLCFF